MRQAEGLADGAGVPVGDRDSVLAVTAGSVFMLAIVASGLSGRRAKAGAMETDWAGEAPELLGAASAPRTAAPRFICALAGTIGGGIVPRGCAGRGSAGRGGGFAGAGRGSGACGAVVRQEQSPLALAGTPGSALERAAGAPLVPVARAQAASEPRGATVGAMGTAARSDGDRSYGNGRRGRRRRNRGLGDGLGRRLGAADGASAGASFRRTGVLGTSKGEGWTVSRAGATATARLICNSTRTSLGPPIITRCSTLSRRTSTS